MQLYDPSRGPGAEQIHFYRENGYLLVPAVFDADVVTECLRESERLLDPASGPAFEATWQGEWRREEDGEVWSVHDLHLHAEVFTRMLVDPRLTGRVAALIGDDVVLHHSKLHAKPAGRGSAFPLHQDHPYFPYRDHSMVAAVVHLDEATVESGCLCVEPGQHTPLPHQRGSGHHYLSPEEHPLSAAIPCPARPGDVLLMSYLTPHGSYPNRSEHPRRVLVFQYHAASDRRTEAVHVSPGAGMVVHGRR